ncbi:MULTISPECIES: hypothetical protein [unclassified Flavobacterium]|uniref:hypothetical protein n=1 Tax=unclassified Flavobacterium TaxID=196869 RepID=UPI00086CD852|nr:MULTISPECIES: hypothetical protein [unclassified Flavobacterium]MBN9285644.1 hypothetical protein [Flavobacterium sp.]ODS91936.1 MAG: hypothetical protein ABS44_00115 [Chryseobacterium sp. SCN 40-13]OJV71000.1 MAG: hypothetical protein BGO42_04090 [Flavobacterium sp. 40-81]
MKEYIKNSFLVLLFIILNVSCSTTENKSIVLTTGLSSNPDEHRFGIEINGNKLYYCEEINTGKYRYFEGEVDNEILKELNFDDLFNKKIKRKNIVDAKLYRLDYLDKNKKLTIKFHLSELEENDILIIEKFIELKEVSKFKEIKYHSFPSELLLEKLPTPPYPNKE